MAQPGQDAKFFQRGKIEVNIESVLWRFFALKAMDCAGIPSRVIGTRLERQEVCQTQDSSEENCSQYYNGQ